MPNFRKIFLTLLVCAGTFGLAQWASSWLREANDLTYYFAGMSYMWYLKTFE